MGGATFYNMLILLLLQGDPHPSLLPWIVQCTKKFISHTKYAAGYHIPSDKIISSKNSHAVQPVHRLNLVSFSENTRIKMCVTQFILSKVAGCRTSHRLVLWTKLSRKISEKYLPWRPFVKEFRTIKICSTTDAFYLNSGVFCDFQDSNSVYQV